MTSLDELAALLEDFVNKISHPRGRALAFMSEASTTVPQVILMNFALTSPKSTPSALADRTGLSLSSASQMLERLAKLGFVQRREDASDRRRRSIELTERGRAFLAKLKTLRSREFAAGVEALSEETRRLLKVALAQALHDIKHASASLPSPGDQP
jgi:DNA-binding MarR family transcriptional regulator